MFAYEPDFNVLMHFFMDNLGESGTTVLSSAPPDPPNNSAIWVAVDVAVSKVMLKLFKWETFRSEEAVCIYPQEHQPGHVY